MRAMESVLIALLLASPLVRSQSLWLTQISNIPPNEMIAVFSPVNDRVCWACTVDTNNAAPSGYIRTTDGGDTWAYARIAGSPDGIIGQIAALDADTAYAAVWVWNPSNTAGVYKTTDRGGTWTRQNAYGPSTSRYGPNAIHFFDSQNGVAEGIVLSETYTTTDGGEHWNLASVPSSYSLEYAQSEIVSATNYVWFVSNGERVFRSSDKGHTWSASAVEPQYSNYFPCIDFQDSSTGLLLQKRQEYLMPHLCRRTTDGGATWTPVSNPILDNIAPTGICHIPGTKTTYLVAGGMSAGQKGLAITYDAGDTWQLLDSSGALYLGFASDSVGWSSSHQHNNAVQKYVGPRLTIIPSVERQSPTPESYFLEQNYPNPFNPLTIIKYTIGVTSGRGQVAGVRLVVYDLLGREVAVLVNETKAPGSYEIRFDASGLASGVYVCKMTAGSFVQSRTMLFVK